MSTIQWFQELDKTHAIATNHVVEIPRKVSHRIENRNENFPLEIVEFQVGDNLYPIMIS